ncbi:MAG TPA: BamA/TamA family outer membrane protein [Gemmatimonadaceae bacterium]|nr:BamA/TamA family outer membrane protein [Gemmatimonadaceae bacterium]
MSERSVPRRRVFLPAVLAALALSPALAGAQDLACDPGDLEVRRIEFRGNESFGEDDLARSIATTPSNWTRRIGLPFGRRRCLDSLEFQRDVYRLKFFYRQRGFYRTQVDTALSTLDSGVVAIRFDIIEGPPVIIDSLRVSGLDTVPDGDRLLRLLTPFDSAVFNRVRLQSVIDTVVERLHNSGYAHATQPLRNFEVDSATNRARVELDFLPGRIARIGQIQFHVQPEDSSDHIEIEPAVVRNILSFEEGDIFRERDLFQSQRDLYQLQTYRHVEIRPAPADSQPEGDSVLTVQVRLIEGPMRAVRVGIGWATLDCVRGQGRFVHRNFLGGARHMEFNARLSKVGVGAPLGGAEEICTQSVRDDPFSDTLNYYVGASFRQPTLFSPRNVPTLTLFSERRSEFQAYLRETPIGGVASVTRQQSLRTSITGAYQIEFGRTVAEPAVFCSVFNICEVDDIAVLNGTTNRLAVVSAAIARTRVDNLLDPRRGHQARLELRHASTLVGSDRKLQFNKVEGFATAYFPVGSSSALAARIQSGIVLARGTLNGAPGGESFVPPQERLYGGGANSVRGFPQNQLGPVVYIVDTVTKVASESGPDSVLVPADRNPRVSPTGGDALFVANLELRSRGPILSDVVEWAIFMDLGQVWNRGRGEPGQNNLRWTPGVGLRVDSPIGPVRVDVAYNPYARQRGAAYFTQDDEDGTLVCVSPRTGPITTQPDPLDCPATYAPPSSSSFFRRLTFHFSIGQAY